jgi:hypothetical protein
LEDYSAGLLNATRAALTGKVDSWRETAGALTKRAHDHGAGLHADAAGYQQVEGANRDRIDAAGGGPW